MKPAKEIWQMNATVAALTALMRIVLDDAGAAVSCDAEMDARRLESEAMAKAVNVSGDNARAAVYGFVMQALGKLVLQKGGGKMEKRHIAYARFRATENGSFACSRPIAASEDEFDPDAPHHGKGFTEVMDRYWKRDALLPRKGMVCWSYRKSGFPARSDALVAPASFPIEERTVAGQADRKHWLCPVGGRSGSSAKARMSCVSTPCTRK